MNDNPSGLSGEAPVEKITVFLADWQVLFREGIHFILSGEEDVEVIGEEVTNEQALSFIESSPPQVAILNAGQDKVSGIEATQRIKQSFPEVEVILVLDEYSEEQLFAALKSGASACLTKDVDPDTVVGSIRQAVRGVHPISDVLMKPEIAARTLREFEAIKAMEEQVSTLMPRLTRREEEVLRHVAENKTEDQIAETLGVTEAHIYTAFQSIHRKVTATDQKVRLIQALRGLPAFSGDGFNGGSASEYVTKEEFDAFKETLVKRFKSLGKE
jgi:DNA-binding NarL/FixJ family response regulator